MQYVEKQVLCEAVGVQQVNYIVPDRHTDGRTDQVIYRGRFGPKNAFCRPYDNVFACHMNVSWIKNDDAYLFIFLSIYYHLSFLPMYVCNYLSINLSVYPCDCACVDHEKKMI